MIKKENGSTTNNKHRAKKIIKLIIYIVLLGLLAFISVKSCNLTLKALEPTATSWDDLNNVDIICNVSGNLSGNLDPDAYYYLNNGNNTSGPTQTPAFQIYDTYNGLAYDEIRIRQTSIYLRGYLYDSQDNFSDYYDRQIWANDFIGESITPDTIRFENLSSDTPSNIVGANVYYPNALNPFSAFLNIINLNFSYSTQGVFTANENLFFLDDNIERNIIVKYVYRENILYKFLIEYYINGDLLTSIDFIIGENISSAVGEFMCFFENYYNDADEYTHFSFDLYFTTTAGTSYDYNYEYTTRRDDFAPLYSELRINTDNTEYKSYIENLEYTRGFIAGREVGQTNGYNSGYEIGYQDGYDDGASNTLNTSWVLSLMNTATSILNIEIFPGFKLIYLVGAFIILMFVRFVIGWVR